MYVSTNFQSIAWNLDKEENLLSHDSKPVLQTDHAQCAGSLSLSTSKALATSFHAVWKWLTDRLSAITSDPRLMQVLELTTTS